MDYQSSHLDVSWLASHPYSEDNVNSKFALSTLVGP
jgi:hypothetical protein